VAAVTVALAVISAVKGAAVAIAPVAVYIDHRSRQGTLTLYNPGDRAEEITVDFGFGYPVSDEQGNISVPVSTEPAPEGEPTAAPWLRAFPRRLRLEPGQKQVVRVIAEPPAGLPEGEYWARALVRSRGGQPPIEQRQGDVTIQLEVETVVAIAVSYRNGAVRTGIDVKDANVWVEDDAVRALVDLERVGNAAYLGRMLVELLDAQGLVIDSTEENLAVYRGLRSAATIKTDRLAEASTVRFTLDGARQDLPMGGALPVELVTLTVPIDR
jgi:hypothetical protein